MGLSTVNQENDEGCVFIQVAYATLDALRQEWQWQFHISE